MISGKSYDTCISVCYSREKCWVCDATMYSLKVSRCSFKNVGKYNNYNYAFVALQPNIFFHAIQLYPHAICIIFF